MSITNLSWSTKMVLSILTPEKPWTSVGNSLKMNLVKVPDSL